MPVSEIHVLLDESLIGEEQEAEVAAWLVADGVTVAVDDELLELSTAKAIVAVQAPSAGRLTQSVGVGETVARGQSLGTITT